MKRLIVLLVLCVVALVGQQAITGRVLVWTDDGAGAWVRIGAGLQVVDGELQAVIMPQPEQPRRYPYVASDQLVEWKVPDAPAADETVTVRRNGVLVAESHYRATVVNGGLIVTLASPVVPFDLMAVTIE